MGLDHVGLCGMKDIDEAEAFYTQALAPLGYKIKIPGMAMGFGESIYKADFWITAGPPVRGGPIPTEAAGHVAFKGTRAQVHAFHEAALQAGGKCNGPPGFRKEYHPFYYGAFVLDPYGNNIEVVNHGSAWQWIWYLLGTKLGFIAAEDTKKAY
ncbi:glyoxalase/bleomycin resistance protein/dioxygenase [Ceratobasidium sp. AG-Ba]|nr:glyoxalase/bleomycin resistance protein/dioxygenase [Ceratobasidium sp. AG-Ba]